MSFRSLTRGPQALRSSCRCSVAHSSRRGLIRANSTQQAPVQPLPAAAPPQQQEHAVARDTAFARRQSQERVRMAKSLRLDQPVLLSKSSKLPATAPELPKPEASAALEKAAAAEPAAAAAISPAAAAAAALKPTEDAVLKPTGDFEAAATALFLGPDAVAAALEPAATDPAAGPESTAELHVVYSFAPPVFKPADAADAAPEPLLAPSPFIQVDVAVVQMDWARAPDGQPPTHFYMPDPLAVPCDEDAWYSAELVDACWQQADRHAQMDSWDPEDATAVAVNEANCEAAVEAAAAAAAEAPAAGASDSSSNTAPEAAEPAAPAAPQTVTVEFRFKCPTCPGERLWMIGDHPALGSWGLERAVKLKWSEGHVWSASLSLERGTKVAYKAVLQRADKEWKWQTGGNYVLEAGSSNMPPAPHEFS